VMGVKVVRLQHRKTRQEFVLVKGLDEGLSDRLMNEQLPRQAIQPMAENLIRLKNPKQAADLTIDKLETSDTEHVTMNHQPVPVRQVNITFHLSNDPQPRSYQGLITRLEGTGKDKALLISFDRQGEFKAELLPQFLDEVRLKG
jgi:hypothetical protein